MVLLEHSAAKEKEKVRIKFSFCPLRQRLFFKLKGNEGTKPQNTGAIRPISLPVQIYDTPPNAFEKMR